MSGYYISHSQSCKIDCWSTQVCQEKQVSQELYWEENYPSRLDLGKDKYGGPFTEEQVDNVKVVSNTIGILLIYIVGLTFAKDIKWTSFYQSDEKSTFFPCLVFKNLLRLLETSLLILFY